MNEDHVPMTLETGTDSLSPPVTPCPLPRADHMGGLLRPAMVQVLRDRGIFDEELELVEDMAVRDVVALQRGAGLRALTDGAVRCTTVTGDFIAGLSGVTSDPRSGALRLEAALAFPAGHPLLRHFRFLRDLVFRQDEWPKAMLPGPQALVKALSRARCSYSPYQDRDLLERDIVAIWVQAMTALYAQGCRYLQMTDTVPNGLGSREAERQARAIATILAARPSGMSVALCLPAAPLGPQSEACWEAMFQLSSADLFLVPAIEEPPENLALLRHLPWGNKRVLLGLVTPHAPRFETVSRLAKSVDSAARHADPLQLGLALLPAPGQDHPGFRDPDHQSRKLQLLAETSRAIWGTT